MKKYPLILILSLTFLYLLHFYFKQISMVKDREAYLSDLNQTIIDIDKYTIINVKKIYPSSYRLWGLSKSKLLKEREQKIEKKEDKVKMVDKKKLNENINLIKRKICLNKKCWEFMGMVTINNKMQVTLLSTDKKSKLESFRVGDELLDNLIISQIQGDTMTIIHKKDKKAFILKLFEVNTSAYSPKNIKEINE